MTIETEKRRERIHLVGKENPNRIFTQRDNYRGWNTSVMGMPEGRATEEIFETTTRKNFPDSSRKN